MIALIPGYKIFNLSHGKGDKCGESRKVREGELAPVVGAVGFHQNPSPPLAGWEPGSISQPLWQVGAAIRLTPSQ